MRKPIHCSVAALLLSTAAAAQTPAVESGPVAAEPEAYNVIAFWSGSCGYCEQLLEKLDEVRKKYSDTPVRFYSVSIDSAEDAASFAAPKPFGFQVLAEGGVLAYQYGVTAIPWVMITNCSGKVVAIPSNQNHPALVASYVDMELVFRGYHAIEDPAARITALHAACAAMPGAG